MTAALPEDWTSCLRRLGWRELEERLGAAGEATPVRDADRDASRDVCPCCGEAALTEPPPPPELHARLAHQLAATLAGAPESVRVDLAHEVEIWPGDILADRTRVRFYPAAGLLAAQLAVLQLRTPTLGELSRRFGRPWVEFHVLRLWLLGLVRLRGAWPPPPATPAS